MTIEVTARHVRVNAEFQEYARKRAEGIGELFPKIEKVHVILDKQNDYMFSAEIVVQKKGETIVGVCLHAENLRSAVDTSAAKAERQLRSHSKRVKELAIRGKAVKKA